jgi:hypothetical protein
MQTMNCLYIWHLLLSLAGQVFHLRQPMRELNYQQLLLQILHFLPHELLVFISQGYKAVLMLIR